MAAYRVLVALLTLAAEPSMGPGPSSIPREGLRWGFDGNLKEASPRHLDGREQGPIGFAKSAIGGQALQLSGNGSTMLGPAGKDVDLSTQEFTVAAWIKPDQIKQAGIVGLGGYFWRRGWLLDMHPDGSLRLELSAPDGKHHATILSGSHVIVPNRWSHVAATVRLGPRAGPSRLYVNGFEVASKRFEPANLANPQAMLTVGGIENANWAGFSGLIDEVHLFSRVLDEAEIVTLVEPGKALILKPEPGPSHWETIAPWALKLSPLDRFADRRISPPRIPFEDQKFSLRPGEVIALTGSTNLVLEQQTGWLETLLTTASSGNRPVFRPMGWEGDTVYEQSRAMNFGGWGEQFDALGASLIVTWFGQVEALDDSKSDREFAEAYARLLDEFGTTTRRLVVIAPPLFEPPSSALIPDNTRRNGRVNTFAEIARRLADKRGAVFVDLATPLESLRARGVRLTDDGMHFTPDGLRIVAEVIAGSLGSHVKATPSLEPLRRAVVAKNRLWFDCWRTMNWAFAYGDRTTVDFPKAGGGQPALVGELERYKTLLRVAEDDIHQLALGNFPAPEAPPRPSVPSPRTSSDSRRGAEIIHLAGGVPDQPLCQRSRWSGQTDPGLLG